MAKRVPRSSVRKSGPSEVVGVVHPLGPGGGRGGTETLWTLRFSFSVWRRTGDDIDERQLLLALPKLTDAKLQKMMDRIKPYDVLRVHVRFARKSKNDERLQAELVKLLGEEPADSELNARAGQLRQPVTLEHPFLGTLTLDRALNRYAATVKWKSRDVHLSLSREGCKNEQKLFGMAQSLLEEQKKWDKRIADFAADELLKLKNDGWLGENEKKFTPAAFKAKMTLTSIAVDPDGSFECTYEDGNLFWGHVIQVGGTLSKGPKYAGIAG